MAAWVEASTGEMGQSLINPDEPSVADSVLPEDTGKSESVLKSHFIPKPFVLQRNATVRSIQAPKTNISKELNRAASSEMPFNIKKPDTGVAKPSESLKSGSNDTVNGTNQSAAPIPVPLIPKPDLMAKAKPESTKTPGSDNQTSPNSKPDVTAEDVKDVQPRSRAKSLGSQDQKILSQKVGGEAAKTDADVKMSSKCWPPRNRLAMELTSKFESPSPPEKEVRRDAETCETEKDLPPHSPSESSSSKPLMEKEETGDEEVSGGSIKGRISLLFDRSTAAQHRDTFNKRDNPQAEISVDIKQRIQNLSLDAPRTRLPSTGAPKSPPSEKTQSTSDEVKSSEKPAATDMMPGDKSTSTTEIKNSAASVENEEEEEDHVAIPVYLRFEMSLDAEKKRREEEEKLRKDEQFEKERQQQERERLLEKERKAREIERQKEEKQERKQEEEKQRQMEERRKQEEERIKEEIKEEERRRQAKEDRERQIEEEKRRIQEEKERLREEERLEKLKKEKEMEERKRMEEERLKEEERLRKEQEQERLQKEKEMEEERIRILEIERQKEEERLRKEQELERIRIEKEMEEEQKRIQEMERQKEEERLKQEREKERLQKEKEMEEERRRIQEMERLKEEERLRQEREEERLQKEKEMEEEKRRIQEMERQKEEERLRQERERERLQKEKEMEEERRRIQEMERQKEEERLRQERERERLQKEKEMEEEKRRIQEMERQKEEERLGQEREKERLQKEKEMEEERRRIQEMERLKEEERLRQERERERLQKEKEMEEEQKRIQEMEKQKEEERLRQEREKERLQKEKEIEEERRRIQEMERLKEEERLRQERENERLQKEREIEERKQMEEERQREEKRLRQERERERLKKEKAKEEERQRIQEMERQEEEDRLRKERENEIEMETCKAAERLQEEVPTSHDLISFDAEGPAVSQTLVSTVQAPDVSPLLTEVIYDDFSVKPRRWGTRARRASTPSPSREPPAAPDHSLQPESKSSDPGSQEPSGDRVYVHDDLIGFEPEASSPQNSTESRKQIYLFEESKPEDPLEPEPQPDEGQLKDDEPEEDAAPEQDTENLIEETHEHNENSDTVDNVARINQVLQRLNQKTTSADSDTEDVPIQEEPEPLPVLETAAPLPDSSVYRSKVALGKKRSIKRSRPSRSIQQKATLLSLTEGTQPDWRFCDSTDAKDPCSNGADSESEEEPSQDVTSSPAPSQPKRVPMFPGMDPSALMAQLKRRGEVAETESPAEAQSSPSVPARSPRTHTSSLGPRVLPPVDNTGSGSSPSWLLELKSKKRMNQPESEA